MKQIKILSNLFECIIQENIYADNGNIYTTETGESCAKECKKIAIEFAEYLFKQKNGREWLNIMFNKFIVEEYKHVDKYCD